MSVAGIEARACKPRHAIWLDQQIDAFGAVGMTAFDQHRARAEREQALAGIVAQSPNFGKYKEKTDREIPVVRLRERSAGPA